MYIYSYNKWGDKMNLLIDNKSGAPIYDQIYSQIKAQIISGSLKEDEMLPSIRGLSKDLQISFITTKRAYDELEKIKKYCAERGLEHELLPYHAIGESKKAALKAAK